MKYRQMLKSVIERTDTRAGWLFDVAVQGLIVLSLITFAVETLPDLSASARRTLAVLEASVVLLLFLAASAITVYIASAGIYYFENPAQLEAFASVFDAMWWAIVSLTTVGYGDIFPITVGGRVSTVLVLIVGLGIVAVPAGVVASALSQVRTSEVTRGSAETDP